MLEANYTLAVVIPCWNCKHYISDMLESLIGQTFTDWRAFVVDDWCTDGTSEIVKSYASQESRICYIKRNRGPKGAQTCRNIGFSLTKGAQYVMFLDADDLIAPYCFAQRVSAMDKMVDKDFLSFPAKAFRDAPFDELRWGFGVKGSQDALLSLLNWRTLSLVVVTNIYRRNSLVDKGLTWDEKLLSMQDADYNIQAFCRGLRHGFALESKIDYFYRFLPNSVSKKIYKNEHYESHLYLIDKELSSIRNVFGHEYDFYLKSFIIVFFEFFNKNKWPYRRLLKLSFVKRNVFFAFRLFMFIAFGLRGKRLFFKSYCQYNEMAVKEWKVCVSNRISELLVQSKHVEIF